jgi:hypothetical protein
MQTFNIVWNPQMRQREKLQRTNGRFCFSSAIRILLLWEINILIFGGGIGSFKLVEGFSPKVSREKICVHLPTFVQTFLMYVVDLSIVILLRRDLSWFSNSFLNNPKYVQSDSGQGCLVADMLNSLRKCEKLNGIDTNGRQKEQIKEPETGDDSSDSSESECEKDSPINSRAMRPIYN